LVYAESVKRFAARKQKSKPVSFQRQLFGTRAVGASACLSARNAQHFVRLNHAPDVQGAVLDRADLEDVTAAGDEIADLQRPFLARKVANRLTALGNELVAKDPGNRPLHHGHPTAAHG
jgi:hypothetical protein